MRSSPLLRLAGLVGAIAIALAGAAAARGSGFDVTPLVSNNGVPGTLTDTNLVNAWGLVAGPTTPWWVADNGSNLSTLYTGAGARVNLVVSVGDAPTGIVFNGTTGFVLPNGMPARFLFDSEAGVISGWNGGTQAQVFRDLSRSGAVFKGLAIATTSAGPRLYATDFRHSTVDVLDASGNLVPQPFFAFHDFAIPRGFAPFGIQAIGSRIYVTYAQRQAGSDDEAHGPGLGFVDAYDASTGVLVARVASRGGLNAPWGIALAPPSFGAAAGDLLVGNFGDGRINAYRLATGGFPFFGLSAIPQGQLADASGGPITIDGLWALEFGNGSAAGPTDSLYFTAGPDDESNGLFGSITAAP
ncbi:MAG TPA: TIGR03118 family protein [Gaiellaceae bacterium]|jgi:uncharacterized protein (TIGR03118 family)